jgi:hypothetical protein
MNALATSINSDVSDYLHATSIFAEFRQTIFSKDFKGGKISNLFGETILDFTDADISGVVELDISQAFGEINLIVPMNWRIETDLSQFLATTRDKRSGLMQLKETDKVLLITGNLAFGAINISNSVEKSAAVVE